MHAISACCAYGHAIPAWASNIEPSNLPNFRSSFITLPGGSVLKSVPELGRRTGVVDQMEKHERNRKKQGNAPLLASQQKSLLQAHICI